MARSGRRSITVHRFPTTEANKFIEIKIAYCEGGLNYFSGGSDSRAYYMHVTPVEIKDRSGGVEIKSYMMFHGYKSKLEDAKRFSQTKFLTFVEQARLDCANQADNIMNIVNRVLAEEKLTLAETVTV